MKLSERKKLAILDAAKTEFLRCGFDGANIDQICQLAEVSKRTLYRHFDTKERLFISVLSRFHLAMRGTSTPCFSTSMPVHHQLESLLQHEVASLSHTYSLPMLRMIFIELLRQPDIAQAMITDIYGKDRVFQLWIEAAINQGKLIQGDTVIMGQLLQGMFLGLFIWPQLFSNNTCDNNDQIESNIAEITRVFLAAYMKHE